MPLTLTLTIGDLISFMLDAELKNLGAIFSNTSTLVPYVNADDNLITVQNPASAPGATIEMMKNI